MAWLAALQGAGDATHCMPAEIAPQPPSRFLVIRAGALGDCLLMLPVLAALRTHFPRAHIEVMGHPRRWEWVLGRGLVDAVHAIERPGMHLLFCEAAEVPHSLKTFLQAFDVILSYRPDADGVFTRNLRRLSRGLVLSQAPFPPPPPPKVHAADYALNLLAELGVHPPTSVPRLPVTPTDLALVQPFFSAHRIDHMAERLVVVHPGSGSEAKRWPLQNFAALLEALTAVPQVRTVVVAGYAEVGVVDRLLPLLRDAKPLVAIDWPLPPTAALIAHATVFVGHDSGLTHLAAAFGRPTVALFGPTDPEIWGPRGEAVTIVHMRQPPTDAHDQRPNDWPSPRPRTDVQQTFAAVQRYLVVEAMQNPGDRAARS
jgi:ADP-heptose:LPS heptosyltransferase